MSFDVPYLGPLCCNKNPSPSVTAVQQLLLAFQLYRPHSGQCQSDASVNNREAEFTLLRFTYDATAER